MSAAGHRENNRKKNAIPPNLKSDYPRSRIYRTKKTEYQTVAIICIVFCTRAPSATLDKIPG